MADDKAKVLIPVDQVIEGDRDATADFAFVRVGASVPLKPCDSAFDLQNPPSQPIAASELHHVLFLAHSQGFFIAKTEDVVGLAKEIKDKGKGPSVEDVRVVDVKVGRVSILALSTDESTLAAAVDGKIFFFSLGSLLKKEEEPLFSLSLDDPGTVKDFKWKKNVDKSFVVLSSQGTLYHGIFEAKLKNVMDNVDAVDWSADGAFVAVARKYIITILSSNFEEILGLSLFFDSWPAIDSEYTTKVDSVKWLRDDSIIIGCLQVNEEGDEEGYLVQVIKSKEHKFSVSCIPVVYSFPDLFDGVWDILPMGRGPYLLANYLDCWDVVLASNQKAIDQHISLFKWSMEDNRREVVSLEFRSDKYTPKIEVPENGDDNLVLGFCVEKVSTNEKITIKVDEKSEELSPGYTLLCLTSEGKLNLFRAARISEPTNLPPISIPLDNNDVVKEKNITLSSYVGSTIKPILKNGVESATSENLLKQINAEALKSQKDTSQLPEETISPQRKQVDDGSQVEPSTGQIRNSMSSLDAPVIQRSGFGQGNYVTTAVNLFSDSSAKVGEGTGSVGRIAYEIPAAMHVSTKDVEHGEVGKTVVGSAGTGTVSFGLQSAGKVSGADIRASSFTASKSFFSNAQERTKPSSISSDFQSSNQHFSSDDSNIEPRLPISFSRKSTQSKGQSSSLPTMVDVELAPTVQGSHLLAQDGSLPGKLHYSRAQPLFENIRASKFPQVLDSEPEFSKQFYNVKNMAKELDVLLAFIEEKGGFRDACTVLHTSSVLALENVLEDLSATSHRCRKDIENCLMEIQQLQNKMLQVSARQGYMKGIVKQASNKKYWDIWNQQKLNPELEAKRQNILNRNMNLTNQIIELERHFNNLEINRFGEIGGTSLGRPIFQSGLVPARQKQSLQSVYNTLNSQLAAAEHLSECLSKQMSELNLNSAPVKRQSIAKELFESIGLSDDITSFQSPVCKRSSLAPDSNRRMLPSTTIAIKEHARKKTPSVAKVLEPETTRRRRDSLDRNWATFEPPKTTVKRSLQVQRSGVSAGQPFRKAKEKFDSQMEAFLIQQKSNATHVSSSSQYLLNDGMQNKHSKLLIEAQSNSGSKWAKDVSISSHIPGSKSDAEKGTERTSTLPQSVSSSLSTMSSFRSSRKELFSSPDITSTETTQLGDMSNPFASKTVASSGNTSTFLTPISPMNSRPALVNNQASKNLNLTSGASAPAFSMLGSTKQLADSSDSVSSITNATVPVFPSAELNRKTTAFNNNAYRNQSSESSLNMASHPKPSVLTSSLPLPFSSSAAPAAASTTSSLTPTSLAPISFGKASLSSNPADGNNQLASLSTSTSTANNQFLPFSSAISTQSQNSLIQINTSVMANSLPAKPFGVSSFDANSGVSNQMASVSTSTSAPPGHSLSSSSTLFSHSQKSSSTSSASLSTSSLFPTIADQLPPVTSATMDSLNLDKVSSKSQLTTTQSASREVEAVSKNENNLLPTNSTSSPLPASLSQPRIPSSTTPLSTTTEKDEQLDFSLSQEDEMEEEAPDTTTLSLGSLGGFELGSTPSSSVPKPNPFSGSFLTANTSTPSPPVTLTAPSGEPFRPASFSLPSMQPVKASQPGSSGGFSSSLGGGFSGFGQPAQMGVGQQALGSVLGTFGQSRQLGSGMPGIGFASSSSFSGGGFSPAANTGGFATTSGFSGTPGGFAGAATGGGFTSVASAGGGFAAAAKGGGFSSLASGGGFAGATSGGFGAVTPPGGGFGSTATAGGGFAGAGTSAGFASGGFGAFGSNKGGGFSTFDGNNAAGAGKPPAQLFTQMRK